MRGIKINKTTSIHYPSPWTTTLLQALLQLFTTSATHTEHAAQTNAWASGVRLPSQFRELGITEGPSIIQKFSAKKWTFHVLCYSQLIPILLLMYAKL